MSLSMTGGYSSMAEACGEAPWQQRGEEPSHVFYAADLAEMDDDELDVVRQITERDRDRQEHYAARRLRRENDDLRAALTRLGYDPDCLLEQQ